ncbi:MAG: bifunctional DNA-formamidopyrimidine glycosylase/DNA-(apurinic or apyrimidinic site) lyase [Rhodospirillaceae bacterium]
MPELPEVETVCRGLAPVLEGRRLARVDVRRPNLRIPFPDGFAARLAGRTIQRVYRRAKYILMDLDDGTVLVVHLGMSGRMVVAAGSFAPERHDHVILTTADGAIVRYNDPRRFGLMTLAPRAQLDIHKLFHHLGVDPLSEAFTGKGLAAALKGRSTAIKMALLDQRIVVGVGNIYACESLHRAGISPRRKAGALTEKRAQALVSAVKDVLTEAIAVGGSSLRDHIQPSGELGYFQHAWRVYGRAGEMCGCARSAVKPALIKRIVQGGRSTFYCSRCQT